MCPLCLAPFSIGIWICSEFHFPTDTEFSVVNWRHQQEPTKTVKVPLKQQLKFLLYAFARYGFQLLELILFTCVISCKLLCVSGNVGDWTHFNKKTCREGLQRVGNICYFVCCLNFLQFQESVWSHLCGFQILENDIKRWKSIVEKLGMMTPMVKGLILSRWVLRRFFIFCNQGWGIVHLYQDSSTGWGLPHWILSMEHGYIHLSDVFFVKASQ